MRDEATIAADARPGAAFPNGSAFERWAGQWCQRSSGCIHDGPTGCPLVGVAMLNGTTPVEWIAADERAEVLSDYTCTEFVEVVAHATDDEPADENPDEGYGEPTWRPVETIKGQEGLF